MVVICFRSVGEISEGFNLPHSYLYKPSVQELRLMKNLAVACMITLVLVACTSRGDRRPERPEPSPERRAEMQQRFLARWDQNGDGAITCDDVAFERAELFFVLDTNEDEELASSEYRYAKFEDKSFMFHVFSEVDTDTSGAVSLKELQAVTHSQFASIDKDGNCIVSDEEAFSAAREKMREDRTGEGREAREGRGGGGRRGGQRPGGLTDTSAP